MTPSEIRPQVQGGGGESGGVASPTRRAYPAKPLENLAQLPAMRDMVESFAPLRRINLNFESHERPSVSVEARDAERNGI